MVQRALAASSWPLKRSTGAASVLNSASSGASKLSHGYSADRAARASLPALPSRPRKAAITSFRNITSRLCANKSSCMFLSSHCGASPHHEEPGFSARMLLLAGERLQCVAVVKTMRSCVDRRSSPQAINWNLTLIRIFV
jgi:hypothetical protein